MRVRVLSVVLALSTVVVLTSAPAGRSAEADGTLVVAAVRVLEQRYFRPVDPVALLNSAIASLRNTTGLGPDALPDVPAGTPPAQAEPMFRQRFDRAAQAGKLSTPDLAYRTTSEMLAALHESDTFYLMPAAYAELKKKEAGAAVFAGIGVNIRAEQDSAGVRWVFVTDVYPDSPAEGAGVKVFDRIVAADGKPFRNATTADVSGVLRGQPGTPVSVVVQRGDQTLPLTIVRSPVRLLPRASLIRPGILYVKVYYFARGTGDEVRQLLRPLLAQGQVRSAILDLRGNGGGYRSEQQSVAGVFLPRETVIGRVLQHAGPSSMLGTGESLLPSIPMVVLIDKQTSTAGIALGLRAIHRAAIVGETARGVGGYGADYELPAGGMRCTFEMIIGPNNEPIEGADIVPEPAVALTEADMERGVDTQLEAALTAVAR